MVFFLSFFPLIVCLTCISDRGESHSVTLVFSKLRIQSWSNPVVLSLYQMIRDGASQPLACLCSLLSLCELSVYVVPA